MDEQRSLRVEIDVETISGCEVAFDGGAILLGFIDAAGTPTIVTLSLNDAGSLAMTLPGLVARAPQARFGDGSLHSAYPVTSWAVEQSSDPSQMLITLRTAEGFSACFSISRQQQGELGHALLAEPGSIAVFQ